LEEVRESRNALFFDCNINGSGGELEIKKGVELSWVIEEQELRYQVDPEFSCWTIGIVYDASFQGIAQPLSIQTTHSFQ
jgi:hypothetical protein